MQGSAIRLDASTLSRVPWIPNGRQQLGLADGSGTGIHAVVDVKIVMLLSECCLCRVRRVTSFGA